MFVLFITRGLNEVSSNETNKESAVQDNVC